MREARDRHEIRNHQFGQRQFLSFCRGPCLGRDPMARAILVALCAILYVGEAVRAADPSLTIIQFTAQWCKPCQSMEPALKKLISEGWQIRQVDIERGQTWVQRFQVTSIPTMVLVREGQEVDRIVGTLGYEKLLTRFVKQALPGSVPPAMNQAMLQGHPGTPAASSPTASLPGSLATVRGQSPAPIEAFPMLDMQAPAPPTAANPSPAAIDNARPLAAAPIAAAPTAMAPIPAAPHPVAAIAMPSRAPTPAHTTPATMASSPRTMSAPEPDIRAAQTIASAATVRIRIDEPKSLAFGTGTIIYVHQEQALVLTCGHLFRDLTPQAKISVDLFHAGHVQTHPATLVSFQAEGSDIGLIEFRVPFALTPVPVAAMSEAPQIGEIAFSMGCDQGADPTRRDTRIKRINRYLGAANIEIEGAPVVGRSGGGLFDAQGRLIGVCNAADAEDDEGIYAALPVIHEHLAALKLPNLAQPQLAAAPRTPATPLAMSAAPAAMLASTAVTPQGMVALDSPARGASGAPPAAPSQPGPRDLATPGDISTAGQWPDQRALEPLAAMIQPSSNPLLQAAEIRCVVRQANGQEAVIHIDRPSQQLLTALSAHLNP